MAGWEDEQQHNRRFAHRSQGRKGGRHAGRNGDKDVFKPRNMLGRYAVRHQAFSSVAGPPQDSFLEIHELDESETGFIASFDLGAIIGVMLIAGSRKALGTLVHNQEQIEMDAAAGEVPIDQDEGGSDSEGSAQGEDESDEESPTASQVDVTLDFARPPELDRPAHAFEKNTFRQPKWFAQWRGAVTKDALLWAIANNHRKGMTEMQIQADAPYHTADDENKAHLEFTTGSCREFNATFSSPYLGLKNISLHGWKETSKTTSPQTQWTSYGQPSHPQEEVTPASE